MGFSTTLSGIKAAQSELNVISHNIANASTVGFKGSNTIFADIYATSMLGSSQDAGSGVRLTQIAQNFGQGSTEESSGELHMAINGNGFFRVDKNNITAYTRAGDFKTNKEGFIENSAGQRLTGYLIGGTGEISGNLGDLRISRDDLIPKATTQVALAVNLDSNSKPPTVGTFDSDDPTSFNRVFTSSIVDSLGNAHSMLTYFIKQATPANTWNMVVEIDGADVGGTPPAAPTQYTSTVSFDGQGVLISTPSVDIENWEPLDNTGSPNGAASPASFSFSLAGTSQLGTGFSTHEKSQNGVTSGKYVGSQVDKNGVISAVYSNGVTRPMGQAVIADFNNRQGLNALGDTSWAASTDSGEAILGQPGTGSLGTILKGRLEQSTTDIAEQLVRMITAQRNFQANAQSIRTEDAITQAVINIR